MTPTEDLIGSIEQTFAAESGHDYSTWSLDELKIVFDQEIDEADIRVRSLLTIGDAHELAKVYGRWMPAAQQRDNWDIEVRLRSGLAHILLKVVVPNRDESRLRASELFEEIGDECLSREGAPWAAIALTNGALAILEMHNATAPMIENARNMCINTLRMRTKGSVDFAYSQMNLALAERQALRFTSDSNKGAILRNTLRSFDQSFRLFKRHHHLPSAYKAIYHHNILETLDDLIECELQQLEERVLPASVPDDITSYSLLGLSKIVFVQTLRSNPLAVGYGETPDWVPSHDALICEVVNANPDIARRISKAREFIEASSLEHGKLRIKLFQTETVVSGAFGIPEIPWESLEDTWNCGDIESYFLSVRSILTWTESMNLSPRDRYSNLLARIYECLLTFRRSWSIEDIERLLKRNPLTFRITGCGFAQLGDWGSAFAVLEASRGLVSSNTLDSDPLTHLDHEDSISWVHVTHSPRASYCIMRHRDQFSGIEIPGLSGKTLAAHFVNLTEEMAGPLSRPTSDRRRSVAFSTEIDQLLAPLSTWLASNTGSSVALIPGGFYQAFPLWACGQFGQSVLDNQRKVYSVPSREIAISNWYQNHDSRLAEAESMSLQDASAVPGTQPLKWSSHESVAIRSSVSSWLSYSEDDASRTSVLNELAHADLFHFAGHSVAEANPLDSYLATYSGQVTCREILDHGVGSRLVVFDSCESGLARNFILQDEMLTLQTAAYYAGADFAIGTSWSVYDPPAFAFTAKFYESLSTSSNTSASSIYRAFVRAVSWLTRATLTDLDDLRIKYGVPAAPLSGKGPAFTFYDWSAFGVVGIDLD